MISYEWFDIKLYDKVDDEYIIYNQKKFEELVKDKFEAVEVGDESLIYWWTKKYICCVMNDHPWHQYLLVLPRNYKE